MKKRITKRFVESLAVVLLAPALAFGCGGDEVTDDNNTPDDGSGTEKPDEKPSEDIKPENGKVRFYVSEAEDGIRPLIGAERAWNSGDEVTVNSKNYKVSRDANGYYIEVAESSSASYNGYLSGAKDGRWYGETVYTDFRVPYSQIWHKLSESVSGAPMFATYNKEDGNKLIFRDAFSALDLALTGTAKISSVKVEALSSTLLSGMGNYNPSRNTLTLSDGLNWANMNCTSNGNFVALKSGSATHICVLVAPGNYSSGLKVTICDADHRAMVYTMPATKFEAGKPVKVEVKYAPDEDLLFFEGFDNFVWGGDIMNGSSAFGYAPDGEKVSNSAPTNRDGYADAFVQVPYDMPGTPYVQSNTWNDVSNKTVGTSHALPTSWVNSRNVGDYLYMFRCWEFPGYILCGGGTARGIFQTCPIGNADDMCNIKLSFDICFSHNTTDDFLVDIKGGGYAEWFTIDGGAQKEVKSSTFKISPTSTEGVADKKKWHRVEASVAMASGGTSFWMGGNDSGASLVHDYYIDNVEVRKVSDVIQQRGTLRVLYWNIQNGMWADQANNYNNFVAWVKKYDPDVCVWCEASTIYKDNTNSSMAKANRFLPDGWGALAARYGHSYAAVGGFRDNYPQAITSKYPIETLLKLAETEDSNKPVSHGAGLFQITVNGRKINFVTLHTWPQAYGYGVASADQSASSAKNEGDYYREYEMKYIIEHTKNAPEYAAHQDWLMMGDFNSRSRLDNWFYGYPENDTRLLVHDVILNNTDYVDIIAELHKGIFMSSTYGSARIDYMYASPSMFGTVKNGVIVADSWTAAKPSPYVSSFYDPSDHRPILVDFNF